MKFKTLSRISAALLCCASLALAGTTEKKTGNGNQYGTSATQKLSFFGAAVTAQPSGVGQSALTDSTTGTASTTLAAGVDVQVISIPVNLAAVTTAQDVLTTYTPGFAFKILSTDFAVTEPATTGSKLLTLTAKISGTATTGGAVALTSSNCGTLGAVVAGSSVTAANTGSSSATVSISATSVTAFLEGRGVVLLRVQNMETANAISSLARQGNALRAALVALGLAAGS